MANYVNFHTQLASIMEVLANAAVAEICQLVDDGFATVRLEVSRTQRENLALKSKLRLMEVRSRDRYAKRLPVPSLVVTCTRKDRVGEQDRSATRNKGNTEATISGTTDLQLPKPEVVAVKAECSEEVLNGGSVGEHPQKASASRTAVRCLSPSPGKPKTLASPNVSMTEGFHPEGQPGQKGPEETTSAPTGGHGRYAYVGGTQQALHSPPSAQRGACPEPLVQETATSSSSRTEQESGASDAAAPRGSYSPDVAVVSGRFKMADAEAPLVRTANADVQPGRGLASGGSTACMASRWNDKRGEGGPATVKMEAEVQVAWPGECLAGVPFGNEGGDFQLDSGGLPDGRECGVSNSRRLGESLSEESKSSELDTAGFDSSSFDELFSSPDVARSLTAPHSNPACGPAGGGGVSSSSFPFLSISDLGNLSSSSAAAAEPQGGGGFGGPSDWRGRDAPAEPARVFSCPQCGRLFSNSRDLLVHQRSHAGERLFHCPLCRKPFLHLHQLKTHQRVHTGEKPFSCTQCGKRFSQSSHIKRHMSVHTGEKRYGCSLCGKRFSQSCSLKVHQAVHTGERPYSCTQCGKSFSVLGNLVRHQTVHIRK